MLYREIKLCYKLLSLLIYLLILLLSNKYIIQSVEYERKQWKIPITVYQALHIVPCT